MPTPLIPLKRRWLTRYDDATTTHERLRALRMAIRVHLHERNAAWIRPAAHTMSVREFARRFTHSISH